MLPGIGPDFRVCGIAQTHIAHMNTISFVKTMGSCDTQNPLAVSGRVGSSPIPGTSLMRNPAAIKPAGFLLKSTTGAALERFCLTYGSDFDM